MHLALSARAETWPIRGTFRIARGARTEIDLVVATLRRGEFSGRGECVPYPRYGESVAGVIDDIMAMQNHMSDSFTREDLQSLMKA